MNKHIIIALLLFVLISGISAAESGTLTISAGSGISYNPATTNSAGETPVFTTFKIDSTDYNHITRLDLSGTTFTFGSNARSTPFTITSGGTGSGTATYSKPDARITWFFSNTTITGSPLVLSYSTNIFSDVTPTPGFWCYNTPGTPSSSVPVYVQTSLGSGLTSGAGCAGTTTSYIAQMQQIFSNNYAVNYTSVTEGVVANVSIDKSMSTVASKINISNSTANKLSEPTFNTNSFSYSFLYDTGIAIRMSDSSGNTDFVIVNSTSYTGQGTTPTPTPTPTVNPETGKGIIWDKSNYTLGETGVLSWAIGDSLWNLFSTQTVVIKKSDSGNVFVSVANIAAQTGSYQFLFSNCGANEIICGYGTYEGIIYTNLLGIFETNREVATANVFPASSSYILINSSVPIKTNLSATIFIGQGGVLFGNLKTQFLQEDGTYIDDRLWSTTLVTGTQNVTVNFAKIGTYRLVVDDGGGGELASKLVSTFSNTIVPPYNISTSRIVLDKSLYNFDEILTGEYEVDSTNYSTGYPTYIDVFNYDINSITGEFYGQGFGLLPNWADTSLQVGSVGIPIQDSAPQPGFPGIRFVSGNNTIRLRIYNISATSSSTLAFYNFTLSRLNSNGYSLEIVPNDITIGSSVKINYVIPSASNITIVWPSNKETSYRVSNSSTITYKPTEVGTYYVYLKDSTGDIQVSRTLNVRAAAPTPAVTPNTQEQSTRDIGNLLASNIFWAFVMITGMMVVTGIEVRKKGADALIPMLAVGILGLGAFTLVGWVPAWLLFAVILALIVSAAWLLVRNQNTAGD